MKKQRKISRRKSTDKVELNISCRDVGRADHEGWLSKKAGGHGIVPIMWKKYWCVVKDSKLYLYKTSFDTAADYLLCVNDYSIENITEKKKTAFCMKPTADGAKAAIFAGSNDDEVKQWMDILNKIVSGIDVSQKDDSNVPDYEERKRVFSSGAKDSPQANTNRKRHSSAFQKETETTGMPSAFGARTTSLSQPRTRHGSGGKAETVLAVGSMFKSLEETEDTNSPQKFNDASELLYKEVTTEVVVEPKLRQTEPTTNELDTLLKGLEHLKSGTYHLQNQEKNEPTVNGEMEIVDISVTTELVPSEKEVNLHEESIAASDDSTEVNDSTLSSITVHSPNLTSSDEVFAVPVSSEDSLEHSVVTPAIEVSTKNTAEVPTEDAQSDDVAVTAELSITEVTVDKHEKSAVESPVKTIDGIHMPLKSPVELFYTGEEVDEKLSETTSIDIRLTLEVTAPAIEVIGDDSKEVVPGVLIDTSVASTTENSVESEVVANVEGSDVIVKSEGTVFETLPGVSIDATADVIADVKIVVTNDGEKRETEDALTEAVVESLDVPTTEVADVANEDEKTRIEVSVSETVVEVATVPTTEVADMANKEEKNETEVAHSESVVEVVAVPTSVADVASKEEVAPSEDVVEVVAVPTTIVADVANEESKSETDDAVSEALPTEDVALSCAETIEAVDVVPEQDAILTEASDVGITNKNEESKDAEGLVNININVSVEEDTECSNLDSKSDDESILDAILKVSVDTSSIDDESMLDAIMKVALDTEGNANVPEVEITEHMDNNCVNVENGSDSIDTSDATNGTSEMVVQSSHNGDVHGTTMKAEVIANTCNGDSPKSEMIANTCNGDTSKSEMIANTCNGDTPKAEVITNTCNGDTSKAEMIANTCNGNTPITVETTISSEESSKPIKNSLIEYI